MDRSGNLLDTIVAQATPPGLGAVAVVRLSGPGAREIAAGLMRCEKASLEDWPERSGRLRLLHRPGSGEALDHALVTLFRAPGSYTGEDVVEISTHGGFVIPVSVVDACVALGARRATAGEFTQRAYLNGKLDLTQAEAVGDLVAAKSAKGRAVALHQLERGLGERIADLRSEVIGLSALLVQHIDFPEEDEAPTPIDAIVARAERVVAKIDRLLATAPAGELLREGAVAVLAGRPNSGKSSLFNALVGIERAIVTAEAGTTRDAIEAVVSIDGFPFRLVDTAGLRSSSNQVEQLGIEIAHRYLSAADVVLYCLEAGRAAGEEEAAFIQSLSCPVVRVCTKWDLAPEDWTAERCDATVSVVSGRGLDALGEVLRDLVFQGVVEGRDEVPVVTSRRQADLLRKSSTEIADFGEALANGIPAEFASAHLKTAESALEEILGVVATDDILDRVFSDFCIGK